VHCLRVLGDETDIKEHGDLAYIDHVSESDGETAISEVLPDTAISLDQPDTAISVAPRSATHILAQPGQRQQFCTVRPPNPYPEGEKQFIISVYNYVYINWYTQLMYVFKFTKTIL